MRRLLIIPLILVCSLCYAEANSRLMEFDFGKIPNTEVVTHKFEIKEDIMNVVSLCDDLKVAIQKEKVIADYPIFSTMIDIEFDPQGYVGQTFQDIILVSKDYKIIRYRIKAFVQTPKEIEKESSKQLEIEKNVTFELKPSRSR